MANYINNKKSVGLKGGPNEYITHISDLFSVEGYKADSPDVNNPYNIIQSGDITMEGVDFPVMGTDNLGNRKLMTPGNNYQFPGDQVFEVPLAQTGWEIPKRKGVRLNYDKEGNVVGESTHIMRTETDGKGNWFSFPTLFQNGDGTWVDMSISLEEPWEPVYQEALKRGEVIDFGTDKEAAIKFGEGSWKKKLKNGGGLPEAQVGAFLKAAAKQAPKYINKASKYIDDAAKYIDNYLSGADTIVDDVVDDVVVTPKTTSITDTPKALPRTNAEDWTFYRNTDVNDMMEPIDFSNPNIRNGVSVPKKMSWYTPDAERFGDYGKNKYTSKINPTNPYVLDKPELWSVDRIKQIMDDGYDAIIVKNGSYASSDIRDAYEVIPLDKTIISELEKIKRMGGDIPKAQGGTFIKSVLKQLPKYADDAARYIDDGAKWLDSWLAGTTDNVVKEADEVITPSWAKGVTHYGTSPDGIENALVGMKQRGKYLDDVNYDASSLIGENVVNHGSHNGRQVVEVALPDGNTQLFYKSSGLAGKEGSGVGGTTQGLWQPYGGHSGSNNWFIKDGIDPKTGKLSNQPNSPITEGYENYYDSKSFRDISGNLDRIAGEQGWDMSNQILRSELKYGGDLPEAQVGKFLTAAAKQAPRYIDDAARYIDDAAKWLDTQGAETADDIKRIVSSYVNKNADDIPTDLKPLLDLSTKSNEMKAYLSKYNLPWGTELGNPDKLKYGIQQWKSMGMDQGGVNEASVNWLVKNRPEKVLNFTPENFNKGIFDADYSDWADSYLTSLRGVTADNIDIAANAVRGPKDIRNARGHIHGAGTYQTSNLDILTGGTGYGTGTTGYVGAIRNVPGLGGKNQTANSIIKEINLLEAHGGSRAIDKDIFGNWLRDNRISRDYPKGIPQPVRNPQGIHTTGETVRVVRPSTAKLSGILDIAKRDDQVAMDALMSTYGKNIDWGNVGQFSNQNSKGLDELYKKISLLKKEDGGVLPEAQLGAFLKNAFKQAPKYVDNAVQYIDDGAKYVDDYFSNVKPPSSKFTTEGLEDATYRIGRNETGTLTRSQLDDVVTNRKAWINSDEYIKRRTKQLVKSDKFKNATNADVAKYINDDVKSMENAFDQIVVKFNKDLGSQGQNFGKRIEIKTPDGSGVGYSPNLDTYLDVFDHEVLHAFQTQAGSHNPQLLDAMYDIAKSKLAKGESIETIQKALKQKAMSMEDISRGFHKGQLHMTTPLSSELKNAPMSGYGNRFAYLSEPVEQNARHIMAIENLVSKYGYNYGKVTDDLLSKFSDDVINGQNKFGVDDLFRNLGDDSGKTLTPGSKGWNDAVRPILENAWMFPAAGVGTVLANQKHGGEQLPKAQVGGSSSSTGINPLFFTMFPDTADDTDAVTKPLLNFDNILSYISDTRGGTKEFWGNTADTVAFHESGAQQRMSALAKQISQKKDGTLYDGPARGVFQFEGPSLQTAQKRYKNIANAKGYELDSEIVNATSADELPIEKQYALFFANLIESDAKLADYPKGNLEQVDLWLQGHKNTEADGDRKSFQESVNEARKNGITGGYKSFKKQYGGGSYDGGYEGGTNPYNNPFSYGIPVGTDVDEIDIPEEETVNILPSPYVIESPVLEMDRDDQYQFERPTNQYGVDVQDLTPEELEEHHININYEISLHDQEYIDPTQVAGFVENANRRGLDYERGFEDFTERSDADVRLLQLDLLDQGYDVGRTGVDGIYGSRTHGAYTSMIADAGLEESAIARYHGQYNPETYTEVKAIQSKLIEKGFLSDVTEAGVTNIDGKFGERTKMALVDYNTSISEEEEDVEGLIFENIPVSLEEERCAAGMCQILELNEIQTEAIGVKHKDAWDLFENMQHSGNSTEIFNIYADPLFDNIDENTSVSELKRITEKAKRKLQTTAQDYKVGDIVGMYYPGSSYHDQTLNSETHNTHSGFVSSISEDGTPIITHNLSGNIKNSDWDDVYTAWIARPNENITLNTTYADQHEADDIENIQVDPRLINNFVAKKERDLTSEETSIVTGIMRRADYNSKQIPEILNSSIDQEWLNAAIFGIVGVETGVGISTNPPPPRTVEDARNVKSGIQGVAYDIKGKKDEDISLGIGKTKFASIDDFAREYFEINSPADLADDNKAVDAVSYILVKNYELFKDYAQQYPQLGLTEEDVRNMALISYNQGTKKLLTTGRNSTNARTSEEEIAALRDLYTGDQDMYSSSLYAHLPDVDILGIDVIDGRDVYNSLEGPSEGYISKANRYITEVYGGSDDENNRLLALNNQDNQPIQVLAKGGEYGVFKNYMNGEYNNTSRLNFAEGVFDKLNRKHYKEAKSSGMSAPNYIMSHLVG